MRASAYDLTTRIERSEAHSTNVTSDLEPMRAQNRKRAERRPRKLDGTVGALRSAITRHRGHARYRYESGSFLAATLTVYVF